MCKVYTVAIILHRVLDDDTLFYRKKRFPDSHKSETLCVNSQFLNKLLCHREVAAKFHRSPSATCRCPLSSEIYTRTLTTLRTFLAFEHRALHPTDSHATWSICHNARSYIYVVSPLTRHSGVRLPPKHSKIWHISTGGLESFR
jgi:hypothetical protein